MNAETQQFIDQLTKLIDADILRIKTNWLMDLKRREAYVEALEWVKEQIKAMQNAGRNK
jgi:hypothetical protein